MTNAHRTPTGRSPDAEPTPAVDGFGPTLRQLRLSAGLTQDALAKRAGISVRAVSDLERDPSRTPRLDTIALIADALLLPPDQRSSLMRAARPIQATGDRVTQPGIPTPLTPLIGRDGSVADLVALIAGSDTRLITLTGTGGVGKTRLVLEVAARVADDFPGGAVFVDLAALRDATLVVPVIARAFGIGERGALPVRERLISVLRDRRALLVIDNFEHVLPARTDLLTILTACPRVVAVVTTRVALRLRGEREYRVDPLALSTVKGAARSPAAALFTDRARAAGVELTADDEPAVEALCSRLDGLPLAIELAAARLRLLSPDDLARKLERRLPLLTIGPDDLPVRQRTMRDAIAWSYQLLSLRQQALFRTLSAFAGGWTLAAAEAVSVDPALSEHLMTLVDASLVLADRAGSAVRFAMMDTIREFGQEQLAEAGETDDVGRRHADHFAALAEARSGTLSTELDNVRVALRWAVHAGRADLALRLCAALSPVWFEQGHLVEGLGWAQDALALPGSDDVPAATRIAALAGAATMAIDLSAFDEATELCGRLVDMARERGSASALALALNIRGLLARRVDRYADAIADHEEALELAERAGDEEGRAKALIGLSYVTFFTGDVTRARTFAERGLAAARATGCRSDIADALLSGVRQALHSGDLDRADDLADEAVHIGQSLHDLRTTAEGLRALGTSAAFRHHYERATSLLEQALAVYRDSGDERLAPQVLAHLGFVALNTGDYARAEELCTQTLDVARHFDDQWAVAMAMTLLGHVELATGRVERARQHFDDAAAVLTAIGNPLFVAWCLEGMAGVAVARGHDGDAARLRAMREQTLVALAAVLPPAHAVGYRQTLDTIAARAGRHALTTAQEAVRGLPLEDLVATARRTSLGG
jgi:predicted ATPase/transcriptional regulator with XRE-family HTH domain